MHHTYCLRMLFDRALLFQEFVERYVIGSLKNIRAPTLYLCIYMFFFPASLYASCIIDRYLTDQCQLD